MAHASRIEYSNLPDLTALTSPWAAASRNLPSFEREPWRGLRSSAAIHFSGPGWWSEWRPDKLSKPLKDELLSTLEARWAVCVAYRRLQTNGGLERAIARTLELSLDSTAPDPAGRAELERKLAAKLDLFVNAGAAVKVRRSGSISFLFEMLGEKLAVSAKDVRTLARQFCIAATPEFDAALELNDRGQPRGKAPPTNSLARNFPSSYPPGAPVLGRT